MVIIRAGKGVLEMLLARGSRKLKVKLLPCFPINFLHLPELSIQSTPKSVTPST